MKLFLEQNLLICGFTERDRLHQTNGYIELTLTFTKAGIMALQNEFETNHSFGEIIGKNKKMRHLFTQIQIAAAGDITVLIQGETGTGKELIAKSIHDNNPRKAGPFVVIKSDGQ